MLEVLLRVILEAMFRPSYSNAKFMSYLLVRK
jgi:hypothetical protein